MTQDTQSIERKSSNEHTTTQTTRGQRYTAVFIGAALLGALLVAIPVRAQTPVVEAENADGTTVFQVNADGSLLGLGVLGLGAIPIEGEGVRLMWYPAKGAFRAGRVDQGGVFADGSEWNDANVGDHSIAFGRNAVASGLGAAAFGGGTQATGANATALGASTVATGGASVAMGFETQAIGRRSVAIGNGTTASGDGATTMGAQTTASGLRAVAMGFNSEASGLRSVAMGQSTTASGENATAMGFFTTAEAYGSLVIGRHNVIAGNPDNWMAPDPLFVAGNGTGNASRANAMTLFKDGNLTIAGNLTENSDRRLKTDIAPLGDVLTALERIEPVRYRFREGTSRPAGPQLGLIAQEVKQAFPELVTRGADGYLSVAYPKLTAVLLGGLQEQQAEIEALRVKARRVDGLEARLAMVEAQIQDDASVIAGWSGWGAAGLLALLVLGGLLIRRRQSAALAAMLVVGLWALPAGAQTAVVEAANADETTVLQVNADGGLFAPGALGMGVIPVEEAGTRLMWHPAKAAFRAGTVGLSSASDGSEWDESNIGIHSVALGSDVTASGQAATALGLSTTASEVSATALGNNTEAIGPSSTAMGNGTTASGQSATALGQSTIASGSISTAMGFRATASGNWSTAMGNNTTASGFRSTAMGNESIASGETATVMGDRTGASGVAATAMGAETTASGNWSTAMGNFTAASGLRSTAMGFATDASGNRSVAMGHGTTSQAYASLVIGRFNVATGNSAAWIATDPLLVAGNGSSDSPSNALTLLKDGTLTIAGTLTESSDRRLKTGIEPLDPALERLLAIEPVRYRYREGTNRPAGPQLGLIAQEVKRAFPELVTRGADGYLSVAYPKLTAVLLQGLREQQTQVETLEARLAALEQDRSSHALASMASPAGAAALLVLLLVGGLARWRRRVPFALPMALLVMAVGTVSLGTNPAQAQTVTVQNDGVLHIANGGVLDLHGSTLDFGPLGETARLAESGGGRVTGGLLTATRSLSAASGVDVAGLGLVFTADQALDAVTVTRGHDVQFGGPNQSIQRYYDLAPVPNGTQPESFDLTLRYADAELGPLPEPELELFHSPDEGATWQRRGFDDRDTDANAVALEGIASLSEAEGRWTLGASSQPLPVELTAFEAALDGGEAVRLTWTTASETNNAGFHIERALGMSADGPTGDGPSSEDTEDVAAEDAAWQAVGFVEGSGTTSDARSYRFRDAVLPFGADRLRYRLRQVDLDGTTSHSPEVEVTLGAPERVMLHAPYPNPLVGRATVRYELAQAGRVRLAVYNALGQRMAVLAEGAQAAGRKEIALEAGRWPSGMYFVRLEIGGATYTRKLTIIR